jgi:hypothetical protein
MWGDVWFGVVVSEVLGVFCVDVGFVIGVWWLWLESRGVWDECFLGYVGYWFLWPCKFVASLTTPRLCIHAFAT